MEESNFDEEKVKVYDELVNLGFPMEEANILIVDYTVRRIRAVIFCVELKNTWSLSTVEIVRQALRKNWTFNGLLSLEDLSE